MSRVSADKQRLFVALWPDQLTRERLAERQREISALTGILDGAVDFDNLHLTLRFLGDVAVSDTEALKASLSTVDLQAFSLQLDRWGQFTKPGILWLGCDTPPMSLLDLQEDVSRACGDVLRQAKDKRFQPHVTLFRKVHQAMQLDEVQPIEWLVDRLVLVRSSMRPEGVQYRVIAEFFAD